MLCPHCHQLARKEFDPGSGNTSCSECGFVYEDSQIVSEVQFGETAGGAAIVQGSHVAAGATGARTVGPNGRRSGGVESVEQARMNGRREIARLGNALQLPDRLIDTAARWYNLAIANGFVKGRRIVYVAAACAYIACRMEKTQHMLIDFSDQLQVNVFVLGSTYLKLVKVCGQSAQIPAIDPSLYITRFTQLLDFGDETQKVAQDAVRLVQRFDRDWMNTGRRPAGICGACCLLAARMNNFRRSVEEVVQVVKIADVTIKKRLDEFKNTPTSQLSVQDFRSVWLEESVDPPAYADSLQKDKGKHKKGKKRKRKGDEEEEEEEEGEDLDDDDEAAIHRAAQASEGPNINQTIDGQLLGDLGLTGDDVIDPELSALSQPKKKGKGKGKKNPTPEPKDPEEERLEREIIDPAIAQDLEETLGSRMGQAIDRECEEQQRKRAEFAEENALDNMSEYEDELDAFILTPDEAKEKERLWMEMNKEYLEHIAAKQRATEGEDGVPKKPRVRKRNKPRDSTTARGATATEAATELLKKKKVSKKLNYGIIDDLFSLDEQKKAKMDGTEASSHTERMFAMDRDVEPMDDEFDSTARMVPHREEEEEPAEDEDQDEEEIEDEDETMVVDQLPEALEESDDDEVPAGDDQEAEFAKLMASRAADEEQFDMDEI